MKYKEKFLEDLWDWVNTAIDRAWRRAVSIGSLAWAARYLAGQDQIEVDIRQHGHDGLAGFEGADAHLLDGSNLVAAST